MEILTSVKRLYISFKSLVNDFVYSFGRAALLLLVEVYNHNVPVRERGRIRVKALAICEGAWGTIFAAGGRGGVGCGGGAVCVAGFVSNVFCN